MSERATPREIRRSWAIVMRVFGGLFVLGGLVAVANGKPAVALALGITLLVSSLAVSP